MDLNHQHAEREDHQNGKSSNHEGYREEQHATSPTDSPPSASSSPSHEFSFTISLHSSGKSKALQSPSFAIDLSPADEIFFHGHLLPLHLLSHIPPRFSTNSLENSSMFDKEFLDEKQDYDKNCTSNNNFINSSKSNQSYESTKGPNRLKSISQMFGVKRWHKRCQAKETQRQEANLAKVDKHRRFEMSQVIKKYARMIKPLLFFQGKKEVLQFDRHNCNPFSSRLNMRSNKQEIRGRRRGECSAPASMTTSPNNSGILVGDSTTSSTDNSTMEELQSAIQAAIAYCKNSLSTEEKLNF